jgi:hypothetical protein
VAEESHGGSRRPHMYRHPDEECDRILGDYSVEDKLEDVSRGVRVAGVDSVKAGRRGAIMTNREVLLRLSVNKHDHLAVTSLHDNNAEIIRTTVVRYFGTGTVADKVKFALMRRMADHARLYQDPEDPDAWLARCVDTQCDRLRNEAIRDEADKN